MLELLSTSLKPGMHTFNVTLLNGAQVVFCQTYNVKVIETQVKRDDQQL